MWVFVELPIITAGATASHAPLLDVMLGNLGNLLTEKSVTLVQGTDGYCQIIAYLVL